MNTVNPPYIWVKMPPKRDSVFDLAPYEKSMALGRYKDKKINPAFFCIMIITLDGVSYESFSE